jgi:hypothetical protein
MIVGKDKVEQIRKFAKMGWAPYTIAARLEIKRTTVVNVLADQTYIGITPTPTAAQVLQDLAAAATPAQREIAALEAKLAELKKAGDPKPAPARVVKEVEAAEQAANPERLPIVNPNVPAVTINPATNPRGSNFQWTISRRPPNADAIPARTEPAQPSTAAGTTFDLFDGKPF